MLKKCRESIKRIATFAKIQSAREASYHLILIDNCQTFYLRLFLCVTMFRVVTMA